VQQGGGRREGDIVREYQLPGCPDVLAGVQTLVPPVAAGGLAIAAGTSPPTSPGDGWGWRGGEGG
jgi:hypothetical protein